VGSALVEAAVGEAKGLDIDSIFLFIPTSEAFYAKHGWKTWSRASIEIEKS
jgi:N-acetylglutamate synthase-like GNAT family acetyltransferase